MRSVLGITLITAALAVSLSSTTRAQNGPSGSSLHYPPTKKVEQTDTYHGVSVSDPYRWLEDDTSPETTAWVEAQNKVTFAYLDSIPYRAKIKQRLTALADYPRFGAPFRSQENYFYFKNNGLQNQNVLYIQKGLDGTPTVFMDPNAFSPDGTGRLSTYSFSKDGKYMGYGVSFAGSDWQEFHIKDVRTKQTFLDTLNWVKASGIAWQGDGFYYSRYPEPEAGKEKSFKNENHAVYYHKVNTSQEDDTLIFEDKEHPQRFHTVQTTEDERFAILTVSDRGTGKKGNALFYQDGGKPGKDWKPIVPEIGDSQFTVLENDGDKLLILTDYNAPNRRIIAFDPKNPAEKDWKTIVAEKPEPITNVGTAGGKLFVSYLKDVTTKVAVHTYEGKKENDVEWPGIGSASGFNGNFDDQFIFFTFTSFNYPPTVYKYDIKTKNVSQYRLPRIPGFKPSDYTVKQEFYKSKDGTRIPMFIVHKNGIKMDGKNPALLYGYGGFNLSMTPGFSSSRIAWMEQGGIFVQANLRGGGEYGEKWHEAGMRQTKQNVFDDFIAAAEYLIEKKYTSPEKLAIQGGSNGGLLIGAVMNQRPELFKAAIPQVGVMDMLRFQKFTIGWNWIADYGSSDNATDFKTLYAYSPLHNLKEANYPATLITTADHDDRVVPAHSFKYAATLQEKGKGANPLLIRIATNSGHGSSNLTKSIEETADIYAFLFYNLGVTPEFK